MEDYHDSTSSLLQPSFRITSVSSHEDDKDSVFSLFGSRESLVTPRAKRHALKLKIPSSQTNVTTVPVSPGVDKRSERSGKATPTAASQYQKSFSDLHKGLDSIFQPKSRPPSRASNFGDVVNKDAKQVQYSPEKDLNGNHSKPLVKSLSRKNLLDHEEAHKAEDDDYDVYHTITGGRIRSLAATRSSNPFSKIVRRPLHRVLSLKSLPPKIDSEDDIDDFESVISLGDDLWRVSRVMTCQME